MNKVMNYIEVKSDQKNEKNEDDECRKNDECKVMNNKLKSRSAKWRKRKSDEYEENDELEVDHQEFRIDDETHEYQFK